LLCLERRRQRQQQFVLRNQLLLLHQQSGATASVAFQVTFLLTKRVMQNFRFTALSSRQNKTYLYTERVSKFILATA
jgi:hypothetical protein